MVLHLSKMVETFVSYNDLGVFDGLVDDDDDDDYVWYVIFCHDDDDDHRRHHGGGVYRYVDAVFSTKDILSQ